MAPVQTYRWIPCVRLPSNQSRDLDGLERLGSRELTLWCLKANDDLLRALLSGEHCSAGRRLKHTGTPSKNDWK